MKARDVLTTPRSRRDFLVGSAAGTATALLASCGVSPADPLNGQLASYLHDGGVTPQCFETEDNPEGPFYRANAPFRNTLAEPTDGVPLTVEGVVMGPGCGAGLGGALLDVWHASAEGEYDNDSSDYLWRGRLRADADGHYRFQTIVPGRYLNGARYRPRHIHLIATADGHQRLITQIYFQGDRFIEGDQWVRERLTIPLRRSGNGYEGTFPIVLAT